MKWQRGDGYIESEKGHVICRSPAEGFVRPGQQISYMLSYRKNIVAVLHADDNPESQRRVIAELKEKCT